MERELEVEHPAARLVVDAGRHDRPEVAAVLGHERQVRAVRADEPAGLVDDELEDLVGVAQGGDPGRDLAQRPLVLGQPGQLAPRDVEVVDEPGVGDRDGRLGREAPDEVGVALAEGVRPGRVDLEGAERTGVADDRRGEHRAVAGGLEEAVRLRRGRELGGQVVVGDEDPALRDRPARQADADRQGQLAHEALVEAPAHAVVVGPAQEVARRSGRRAPGSPRRRRAAGPPRRRPAGARRPGRGWP